VRNARIEHFIEDANTEARAILEELPTVLKTGYRTLFLLERKKDGGHNKEDRRAFNFVVTTSEDELLHKLKEFLWLRYFYENELRLYLSVNERSPRKTVRNILSAITDSLYADELNRETIARKICKGSRSYIMATNAAGSSLFLLDVNNEPGKDVMGDTLQEMARVGVEEIYRRPTRNGWHIVTKPFNPALWKGDAEIKKDGLLLLK